MHRMYAQYQKEAPSLKMVLIGMQESSCVVLEILLMFWFYHDYRLWT